MTISTTLDLLTGTDYWKARCELYDYIQGITFAEEGRGEMIYGQDQRIVTFVKFSFKIIGSSTIAFEFFTTERPPWGVTFQRDESNAAKSVKFHLLKEETILRIPLNSVYYKYDVVLRFDADPFPGGWQPPGEAKLDYLGYRTQISK